MKPGDSDRFITFNEGLDARVRSEGYSMQQTTRDTEPQLSSQDKAIRNMYAELLNGAINDLRRGLHPEEMRPRVREDVVKQRQLVINWMRANYDSTVSLDFCLFVLGICKSAFINSLVEQGLLPEEETSLESTSEAA